MMIEYPRLSGRIGNILDLNVTLYHNGIPTSPYAIRRIDIFKGSIRQGNILTQIFIPYPTEQSYPSPIIELAPGQFSYKLKIPNDYPPNEIYYDVWNYIGNPPGEITGSAGTELTNPIITGTDGLISNLDNQAHWISDWGQFWVYDDDWIEDDGLLVKNIAFEPLDKLFRKGEIRTLEVGFQPLPLYNFDYNKIAPLLPNLKATISFMTVNCEPISGMQDIDCTIGVRSGDYRRFPFTIQCLINTTNILIGTYAYKVKVKVGEEIIISEQMHITVE